MLAGIGTMTAGICETLNVMVDQVTAAPIKQPQTEVTDLTLTAQIEETINFYTY